MENSYGIGVRNRYELFYNDDVDPLDLLKQTEKKKKDKGAEKENKASKIPKTKEALPPKKSTKTDISPKSPAEKTSQTGITKPQQTKQPRINDTRVKFSDREERNNRRNKQDGEIREPRENRDNRDNREPRENRDNRDFREVRDPRDNRDNRDYRENRESRENSTTQRFDGDARGAGRGRGSGFGRSRGGRRGGVGRGDFRGKREFDRQSGMVTSGVKPVDKREGSGSFNWGSDKDQITEEQLQTDAATELDTSGENAEKAPVEEGAVPTEDEAAKDEDGQKEMTLDEWKALQKREKPVFKIRRPGEGENTAQWKKTYVLKKKVEEETSEEEEEEDDEIEVHHGRKKVLLPIDFQFADTPTRGRGRGRGGRGGGPGRGRGMGGRGRGSRFAGSRQEAPKMDDERDFPSLG